MEVIGSICAVIALGVLIGLAAYEWILWRERTKAEIQKFKAETVFYNEASAFFENGVEAGFFDE